jgi:hypothetical protein
MELLVEKLQDTYLQLAPRDVFSYFGTEALNTPRKSCAEEVQDDL